jgi:hypothetical protein
MHQVGKSTCSSDEMGLEDTVLATGGRYQNVVRLHAVVQWSALSCSIERNPVSPEAKAKINDVRGADCTGSKLGETCKSCWYALARD